MGLFFKDYESSGSGIAKNAPKKKGFALFCDIFFRKFWNIIGLNMLYFLFFIPLVLAFAVMSFIKDSTIATALIILCLAVFAVFIGPATAGLTKVMRKFVLEKHSFITRDFFDGFKENFKKALIVGILDVVVALSAFAAYNVYPGLAVLYDTKVFYVPMVLTLSLALTVVIMNFYVYLMMVATDLSFKELVKNSFALTFVGMKINLVTFVIYAFILISMLALLIGSPVLFMILMPFIPAAILWFVVCFNSYPVIQKYVINPYYTNMGKINPELLDDTDDEVEQIFEDMGGKEKPIEKRKKGKGRHIS